IGGPPAYPNVQTGTYPSGFVGFTQGFVYFDYGTTALPTGNYTLTVNIPAGNHAPFTTSAVGTLTTAAGLPAFAAPTFVSDGLGGGAGTVVVPAGCTEVVVDITDTNVGTYYTVLVTGSGTQAYVLPDNLGPQSPKIPTSPSIPVGDGYSVVAVGADYPLFEAGPPGNTSEKPTIVGANGQADVTISPVVSGTE
ncbi:MAG TPA: hypothetical protein VKG44_10810, partial [Candidatus Baltobacteraceae bacterium]|nr:hypothetical protein [Candidatus Baltobacteraceae bacterium]